MTVRSSRALDGDAISKARLGEFLGTHRRCTPVAAAPGSGTSSANKLVGRNPNVEVGLVVGDIATAALDHFLPGVNHLQQVVQGGLHLPQTFGSVFQDGGALSPSVGFSLAGFCEENGSGAGFRGFHSGGSASSDTLISVYLGFPSPTLTDRILAVTSLPVYWRASSYVSRISLEILPSISFQSVWRFNWKRLLAGRMPIRIPETSPVSSWTSRAAVWLSCC